MLLYHTVAVAVWVIQVHVQYVIAERRKKIDVDDTKSVSVRFKKLASM